MPLVRAIEQQQLNSSNNCGQTCDDSSAQMLHSRQQQLAHCCCQQREQLIERHYDAAGHHHHHRHQQQKQQQQQDYVIVKKCRQCRKQIQSHNEQYDENEHEDEENVRYCECLLRNQARAGLTTNDAIDTDDTGDDDDDEGGRRIAAKQMQRVQHLRSTHANVGKRIKATTNAAISLSVPSTVALMATSASSSTSPSSSQAIAATETVINSPQAVKLQCHKNIVGDENDSDADTDDDKNNDVEDLHARLVSDKLEDTGTSSMMDTSGLPTYDAASKLPLMCSVSK